MTLRQKVLLSFYYDHPTPTPVSEHDAPDVMVAVEACREAAVRARTRATIGSEGFEVVGELLAALDRVAEAVTGDRERFWNRLHSTPKGS
jgi:hypothetical protein